MRDVVYRGHVDFDAYAHTAVEIINAPVTTPADLILFLGTEGWLVSRVSERDLTVFRRTRRRLRGVFEHGAGGRADAAVAELNALLEAFPVRPRIAGPADGAPGLAPGTWRMHVTGRGSSASSECLAGAIWGLAVWLCEHGSSRCGVCADERCGNVYLDTSSNCCRRFCSERCATRSHVAAHRARKRAAELATVR